MADGSRGAALSAARRASARYRTSPWPGKLHLTGHRATTRPAPVLTFLGGDGCARYLLETPDAKLVIGCGLFAGPDARWRRNFSPGPDELHTADAVILPGAGLGQAGFLPQLVAEGWHGPVFATPGTAALLPIVLADAAAQFAEDAERSPFGPALPPFRAADVTRAVALVRPVEFGTLGRLDGAEFEFGRAGGRLGAAWVRVRAAGRSVLFAGPLGAAGHPLLRPPDPRPRSDVLVLAAPGPPGDGHLAGRFAAAVHRAVRRGGSVVVPVSAAGGAELVLTMVRDLMAARELPRLPVLLDSPAGSAGIDVHRRAAAERWHEVRRDGVVGVPPSLAERMPDRSSLIVAGLETADAGRVLRQLETLLPDPRNGVVLLGHPVPGTRAAELAGGARQLKIHGRYVPVRAEVTSLGGTGEFAGPAEVLEWASATPAPETAFVVEGAEEPSSALAKALHAEAGWCAVVPADGERVLC
ncbi:MBL fold metallo-hydrolase [Amycolatopsis sp. FBCC-B4732]|uniref:MBL fold metallo-hydrolase n=1 Tax=Amycolatopsis sp. FBCC-B4732 TaxID=3079339 RepID=UPI001FF4B856|nr:MBL fold metallo-hydrolase [Amycolatopsis sp. FBCC-B4732]UOX90657.1 MBL fold metallo-hydrolase [Amycolatopsis sp. FBCC-B4732]